MEYLRPGRESYLDDSRYLAGALNPTGYAQVVEETVNGAPEREYTYGLQRIDEDQIVNSAWTVSFYGYDGFGTVRQLTNSAGAVTDTWEYDAFGNEISSTGTTPNEMLYRGEQYDPDLGLYYLRARWYNPQTGRFMSRDPNAGNIAIPTSLHKYLYADGDPVDGADPSGRADLLEYLNRALTALEYYNRENNLSWIKYCESKVYAALSSDFAAAAAGSADQGTGQRIANEEGSCVLKLLKGIIEPQPSRPAPIL